MKPGSTVFVSGSHIRRRTVQAIVPSGSFHSQVTIEARRTLRNKVSSDCTHAMQAKPRRLNSNEALKGKGSQKRAQTFSEMLRYPSESPLRTSVPAL